MTQQHFTAQQYKHNSQCVLKRRIGKCYSHHLPRPKFLLWDKVLVLMVADYRRLHIRQQLPLRCYSLAPSYCLAREHGRGRQSANSAFKTPNKTVLAQQALAVQPVFAVSQQDCTAAGGALVLYRTATVLVCCSTAAMSPA